MEFSLCFCAGFHHFLCFSPTVQKYAARRTGYAKLPIGVKDYVNERVNGALRWTGVPIWGEFSRLAPRGMLWIHRHPEEDKALTEDERRRMMSLD